MNYDSKKIERIWYGDGQPGLFKRWLSKIYAFVVNVRVKLYQKGVFKKHRLKVPVIVVGNITAGGGGKTPVVIWLCEKLKSMGYKPGVISRGYGGKRDVEPMFITPHTAASASGDEALLIAQKAQVPVFVGKNRVKAGTQLAAQYPVNCIVSDDGMQHYRLHRSAEIVMIDARLGLGNEQMLPAGPLREPKQRLDDVDLILYKGERQGCAHYSYSPAQIYQLNKPSVKKELNDFRSQKLYAMAGIASPDSFFKMLSANGLAVIKKYLPDHHKLELSDFEFEHDYPVLITEKDAVKCTEFDLQNVWVVDMQIEMNDEAEEQLNALLLRVLQT